MKITRKNLNDAVDEKIITADQASRLHEYLNNLPSVGPTFNFTNVLYYLGGLIAIGAMTLFMNLGWESFGGWGIFLISLAYAGVGLKLVSIFEKKGYVIPAGICATFAVALTPLAIYGLQKALGLWPDESVYREFHKYTQWHWLYIEFGTLIASLIVIWRYKYPFLVMPIAVTLWYMSIDVAIMIKGDYAGIEFRALVSMYFGMLMIFIAFWADVKSYRKLDYAFWLYIFGVIAFWGGMTAQESDSELSKFVYFCVNLLMIACGVIIVKRVFVVFGAIGVCLYFGHLASEIFEDSWLFPITLTAVGLLIIYLGIVWQKNEKALTEKARSFLPEKLRVFLESKAN